MDSKAYYSNQYHVQLKINPNNYFMYGYILAQKPKNIFEFGCNAGRHLNQLNKLGIKVSGIDVNVNAIRSGKSLYGLALSFGDEKSLLSIKSKKYDLVFTNSVLCHIPKIDDVVKNLKRIGKKVILFEAPYKTGEHWYKHDYKGFREVWNHYSEAMSTTYVMYENID